MKPRMGRIWIASLFALLRGLDAQAAGDAPRQSWSGLVPVGYEVTETLRGDLNGDGRDDVVLMVKANDPSKVVVDRNGKRADRNRRGILIAFQQGPGYEVVVKNLACFSSGDEDGGVYMPPDLGMSVDKGRLVLHYAAGRYGYWQYTFRYQHGDFALIGFDSSDNHGPVVERTTSVNLLSDKVLKRVNVNDSAQGGDERFVETWSKVPSHRVVKLAEIRDFDEYSVEHELGLPLD